MFLAFDHSDNTIHHFDDDGNDSGEFCEGFIVVKTLSDIFDDDETVIVRVYTKAGVKDTAIEASHFTVWAALGKSTFSLSMKKRKTSPPLPQPKQ